MGVGYEKSKAFAIRVVRLYSYLCNNKKEYVLSKQLLRSGTSIGANRAEAECAISKKEFLAKVYVALKECSEAQYWLELLYATEYITNVEYNSIRQDAAEIRKILTATTKTLTHS